MKYLKGNHMFRGCVSVRHLSRLTTHWHAFDLKCRCYIGYDFLHMFQLCTCKLDKEMHIVVYVDCNKLRNLDIGLVKYALKDYWISVFLWKGQNSKLGQNVKPTITCLFNFVCNFACKKYNINQFTKLSSRNFRIN